MRSAARPFVLAIAVTVVGASGYNTSAAMQPASQVKKAPAAKAQTGKTRAGKSPRLTTAEQERFDAGHEIYANICQVCHQPDGRGREKLAPSLVGSPFLLGSAEVPVRIVLQGKQGMVGLMPPLGATLNDEQIADVLTYVRHEWGQKGSSVNPGTVKDVRARTADHTKPWTDEELKSLKKQ